MEKYLWILIPLAFPVVFIPFWCFVCFIISLVSGWNTLAREFQTTQKPEGKTFFSQRAMLNGARYNHVLNVTPAPQGLHLNLMSLFRAGHPPLLIPWSKLGPFSSRQILWLTANSTTISTGAGGKVVLTLFDQKVVDAISGYLHQYQ